MFTEREKDVREHRLTEEELQKLQEAKAKKAEEEKQEREQKQHARLDEDRRRELEWVRPGARVH